MADIFMMMLAQVNGPKPPEPCILCHNPRGVHYVEVYTPREMSDADESDPRWQSLADLQAHGAFMSNIYGMMCTGCLGESLTKLHGPSRQGLPYFMATMGVFTIASFMAVSGGLNKMAIGRGILSVTEMYHTVQSGQARDLGPFGE